MICVLRWAENPRDSIAAFRVLQMLEGIGPTAATRALDYLENNQWDLSLLEKFNAPPSARDEWKKTCDLLVILRDKKTAWQGQVGMVRKWYTPHLHRMYDTANVREQDVEQLELMSSNFPDRETFLTELTLDPPDATSDEAGKPLLDEDYLILSTIHSAKGKEWNVVFILHVSDGCIPSDMATGTPEQMEEERRLLYVAMTRAKDHLYLIQPLKFFKHGYRNNRADAHIYSQPSRFFTESVVRQTEKVFHGREKGQSGTNGDANGQMDIASKVKELWA